MVGMIRGAFLNNFGFTKKSNRNMYNTYQKCRGTSLLPAHMNTGRYAGKVYAIDPRSPLSARDFVELLSRQNSVRSLTRIAAKMGLRFKTSKAETKAVICDALTARKIAEPVLIGGVEARKTKSILANNSLTNTGIRNQGNVNQGVNTGPVNQGNRNTGPMNQGNRNIGPMNQGNKSANNSFMNQGRPTFQLNNGRSSSLGNIRPRFKPFAMGGLSSSSIGAIQPRFQPFNMSPGGTPSPGVTPSPAWTPSQNNGSVNTGSLSTVNTNRLNALGRRLDQAAGKI